MKLQKQITVIVYRGYNLRHSATTGHVTIYDKDTRLVVRNSMALAKGYVDATIAETIGRSSRGNETF